MNICPESFDFFKSTGGKNACTLNFQNYKVFEHGKTPKEVFKIITLGGYICSNNVTIWLKSLGKFFFHNYFQNYLI